VLAAASTGRRFKGRSRAPSRASKHGSAISQRRRPNFVLFRVRNTASWSNHGDGMRHTGTRACRPAESWVPSARAVRQKRSPNALGYFNYLPVSLSLDWSAAAGCLRSLVAVGPSPMWLRLRHFMSSLSLATILVRDAGFVSAFH